MTADLARRLAELEQRVAVLEGGDDGATVVPLSDDGGTIAFRGETTLPGAEARRKVGLSVRNALALTNGPSIEVIAALGHPARVEIVRRLLANGPQSVSALQDAAAGSPGRLYHHLKPLMSCGLVEQHRHGSYRISTGTAVSLVVLLAAAADIAGAPTG